MYKGQVALEANFRFVLDKSDLKSASDKRFVRKATVALKNKICEQNTTPCCERLPWPSLTDRAFQPTVELKASSLLYSICSEPSCSRLTNMHCVKKMGLMPALTKLSSLNWRDSGNESVLVVEGNGLAFPRSLNMDPSWWILWRFVRKNWSPAPGFMLLRNENVNNFTSL